MQPTLSDADALDLILAIRRGEEPNWSAIRQLADWAEWMAVRVDELESAPCERGCGERHSGPCHDETPEAVMYGVGA